MADTLDDWFAYNETHPVRYRLRRLRYVLMHPRVQFRQHIYWPIRTFIERGRRGWSVEDTWSLDTYIARVLSESVEHLRAHSHGYPGDLTPEAWDAILAEMAMGFAGWADHFDRDLTSEDEAYRQAQRSIRLMHHWFGHLWD